jgi:PleD family two-component response regulator
MGVSFYQKGLSLDLTLKKADLLLYKGKESGRNQVSYEKAKLKE